MSSYFVVHLKGLNSRSEDWLSQHAFAHGALGVSEVLPFSQPEGEEDVFTQIPDSRNVDVYFETAPSGEFIESVRAHFPEIVVQVANEQERDWLAEWKKGFKPFALAGNHWVVPSWCEAPEEAKHAIRIDPGMAFGTGTHETTQLVAEALMKLPVQGGSVLDVGTGTGILAVLALQLGAKRVWATEIEEDSRRVARENFNLNGGFEIIMNERQVEDLNEKFTIVVANIIDGVLVRIQDALKARVKPGGWLVVSGIIAEREKDFLDGFQLPAGKTWNLRTQKGDWILYAVEL